jgi:hypothetical protein
VRGAPTGAPHNVCSQLAATLVLLLR